VKVAKVIDGGGDRFLWLEDLDGEDAARWVGDRNAETVAAFEFDGAFAELRTEIRHVLDAEDRISYPGLRGEYLYDFWQDAAHPRGLWRRTTLEQYRLRDPAWDVLLDVDALGAVRGSDLGRV
jgi:prolyl oligopeptidase